MGTVEVSEVYSEVQSMYSRSQIISFNFRKHEWILNLVVRVPKCFLLYQPAQNCSYHRTKKWSLLPNIAVILTFCDVLTGTVQLC